MSLRRRLGLLSAAAVAATVIVASAFIYLLVRDSLRDSIDDDLRAQAAQATQRLPPGVSVGGFPGGPGAGVPPDDVLAVPPPDPGGAAPLTQLINGGEGAVARPGSDVEIPVTEEARALARDGGEPGFEDVEADGTTLRVLTQPDGNGLAIQVAASLEDTEDTLGTLLLILVVVSLGGVAAAAALGPVVARTALAPAGEVSDAAQEVARTRDLTRRIEVRGDDELGRLSSSFNEMMEALQRSDASQRRLVADASHELRTPLAVLRTNIETLGRSGGDMDASERAALVGDVTEELEEMTALVADVVELAREPGTETLVMQDLALDELVSDAVASARRRFREVTFEESVEPALVHGDRQRLGRAISNLLDNAGKWSSSHKEGGIVEVKASEGRVSVRDHGPGFDPADLDKVFDRFWRADESRGKQGSGLGLAIVQRVAEEHGGRASADNAPEAEGGGAIVTIEIPVAPDQEPQATS